MKTDQKPYFVPVKPIFFVSKTLRSCTQYFWGSEKYHVSAQNWKGPAFSFTEKHLFITKMGWKSTFNSLEAHVLAWLGITVLYNYLRFWKISSFSLKLKGRLQFYRQMYIHCVNRPKIYISSPWGSYSCSIRYYGDVQNFFEILKILSFGSKLKYLVLTKNVCSL
jgi:hypothetical protein